MRKSPWLAALATTLALTVASPASAAVSVQLNGQPLTFDLPPIVESGRTLVPVQTIAQALGASVTIDPKNRSITAVHYERDKYVVLILGVTTAWVNGEATTLEVAPKSVDGHTMVPLRFISTALDAEVDYDPTTETAIIAQASLTLPDPTDEAHALSRYTRAIAYTHHKRMMPCLGQTQARIPGFTYLFSNDDPKFWTYTMGALADSIDCWNTYETKLLAPLTPPAGAMAAHQELQTWVDLNQQTLLQLQQAAEAHSKGALGERDRLFEAANQSYDAVVAQEPKMREAMNAITSDHPEFMTVAEHQYVAWLDSSLSATIDCFYPFKDGFDLHGVWSSESAARWAQEAADCWVELPAILSEQTPPTERMKALLEGAIAWVAQHTAAFQAFAAKCQAGPVTQAEYEADVEAIYQTFFDAVPALDQLFFYRDYGNS